MTTHEVLVRARALVERGWVPYGADGTGAHRDQYCAIGAIAGVFGGWSSADAGDNNFAAAQWALRDTLGFYSVLDVVRWSDRSGKSAVLAGFDRAIAATAPEPDTDFLNEVRVEEPVAS